MDLNKYIVNAAIPSYWGWTAYTPVIPKLYWDVYSQEERIKRLCKEYDKLTHYASMIAKTVNDLSNDVEATLDAFEKKLTEQLAAQDEKIAQQIAEQNAKVEAELAAMRLYIDQKFDEYAQGTQTYDVTTGTYRPSYQAMRRLFQALSFDHKGTTQLVSYYGDNKTVAELAAQTVYNAAYSNRQRVTIDDQLQDNNLQ